MNLTTAKAFKLSKHIGKFQTEMANRVIAEALSKRFPEHGDQVLVETLLG